MILQVSDTFSADMLGMSAVASVAIIAASATGGELESDQIRSAVGWILGRNSGCVLMESMDWTLGRRVNQYH